MSLISLKHFRRKLFALALAIILWFFVTENNVLIEQKTVDIEYRGLPDNVIIVESLQKLSYSISKNPYYPTDIKSSVKPYVEIGDATPGWHNFPIRFDISPPLPAYANIHPSVTTARILLDNRSSKSVLIKPNITLSNTEDFYITDIRVNPEIIQISGPESVLENIKTVFLDTVTITKAGDYKIDSKIVSPAYSVSIQDMKVSLQFSVKSNYKTDSLTVPVKYRNLSPNLRVYRTSLPSVVLRIRGLGSQLSVLRENLESIAYLDLLNVDSQGAYPKVPLKIDLPKDITVLNARNLPSAVDISVEDAPLIENNDSRYQAETPPSNEGENVASESSSQTNEGDPEKKESLDKDSLTLLDKDSSMDAQKNDASSVEMTPFSK